jgi:hypothetical protein
MSGMKSMLGMYALAAMAMSGDLSGNNREIYIEPKETDEERKVRLAKAERERYKSQGLTEFFYGENSLWALNQKSADRKARHRHWL